MKLILILTIVVSCQTSFAQEFKNEKVIAGATTFLCENSGNSIKLKNEKNVLWKTAQYLPSTATDLSVGSIEKNDEERSKIMKDVFSHDRIIELKNEVLAITFFIDDTGKVLETSFTLQLTTKLRAEEIATLENKLKEKLVFSFRSNELKGANYIMFMQVVRFQTLL